MLIDTLSREYSVPPNCVLASIRDSASCNRCCISFLELIFQISVNVCWLSHTLNLVGDKFKTPTFSEFMLSRPSLFSQSPKSIILWKEQTKRHICSYCPTTWWAKWKSIDHVLELFVMWRCSFRVMKIL